MLHLDSPGLVDRREHVTMVMRADRGDGLAGIDRLATNDERNVNRRGVHVLQVLLKRGSVSGPRHVGAYWFIGGVGNSHDAMSHTSCLLSVLPTTIRPYGQ